MKYLVAFMMVAACGTNSEPPGPDSLALVLSVTALDVTEGMTTSIDVHLDHVPAATLTVALVADGAISVSPSSLTFTADTFDTPQAITIASAHDADVADASGSVQLTGADAAASISVTVRDDDSQAVVTSAPVVTVGEGASTTLDVSFAFAPATDTTLSVASMNPALAGAVPSTLTFTATDYAVPQQVTITAAQDLNLTNEVTKLQLSAPGLATEVMVDIIDDDKQQIVLSATSVMIPEGENRTVDVSLAFEPPGPVTVTFSSNNFSIPVFPEAHSYTFSPNNYGTPRTVTLATGVDRNGIDETATISFADASTNATATLTATIDDLEARQYYGWTTDFEHWQQLEADTLIAVQITGVQPSQLDSFYVILSSASWNWRPALYADAGGVPGTLVVDGPGLSANNGINLLVINPVALAAGTYWIAFRVSGATLVNKSAGAVMAPTCVRAVDPQTFAQPWPASFGAATCGTAPAHNLYIDTRL